jgi:hypothetical protein
MTVWLLNTDSSTQSSGNTKGSVIMSMKGKVGGGGGKFNAEVAPTAGSSGRTKGV